MRFHWWLVVCLCWFVISTARSADTDKQPQNSESEDENNELDQSAGDRVETISSDIKFNSWNELYDYLKELEDEIASADEAQGEVDDEKPAIRLQLMTDGDALTLDDDGNDDNDQVVVQGTITEVIREVPAPDLSHKDEEEIEKEQPKKNKEKGRIMATEAEWNFMQDNLILQGQVFETLKNLASKDSQDDQLPKGKQQEMEIPEVDLTEDQLKGKEMYEKAKQITTLTKANRRAAHDLYQKAAELNYYPAREKVAWSQLLGSSTSLDFETARKTMEELSKLGRPDSQMVNNKYADKC